MRWIALGLVAACQTMPAAPEGPRDDALFLDAAEPTCDSGEEAELCAGKCECLIANPDFDWCPPPDGVNAVCTDSQCFKKDLTHPDCSFFYTGPYCGCEVADDNSFIIASKVMVAEADCVSAGKIEMRKLFRYKHGDEYMAGYDDAYCNFTL